MFREIANRVRGVALGVFDFGVEDLCNFFGVIDNFKGENRIIQRFVPPIIIGIKVVVVNGTVAEKDDFVRNNVSSKIVHIKKNVEDFNTETQKIRVF